MDGPFIIGWANHPVHQNYAVIVHALLQGVVVSSVLADVDLQSTKSGFLLQLPMPFKAHELSVLIGETDEYLLDANRVPLEQSTLTVEDLIRIAVVKRPWIDGSCDIDAAKAGLETETIIDLICRDYLGHPAEAIFIAEVKPAIERDRSFNALRQRLIKSQEYHDRRIYAEDAPGSIFSSQMVKAVTANDFIEPTSRISRQIGFSMEMMLEPNDEIFVTASYQHIHNRSPDKKSFMRYLRSLEAGTSRQDVVRNMALELKT